MVSGERKMEVLLLETGYKTIITVTLHSVRHAITIGSPENILRIR